MAEKTYTTNPFKGKKTLKRLKNVVRNAPVVGTLIDIADIGKSLITGNYSQAAIDAGIALAGVTPVGKITSKGIQKTLKLFSKNEKDKPLGLTGYQIGVDPVNYGSGNVREPYVKTVVVPIKQAQKLFPSREKSSPPEYLNALKNEIEKGRKIAPPFLDVEVPKKGSALLVKNHEGAHRIAVLRSLGYEYVPIDIISNVKLRGVEGDKIYKSILEGDRIAGLQGYNFTKRTGYEYNQGGLTTDQQMSSLLRKPIKAHKGTIVDGQIVYEKDDVESTTSPPKESAPVATPTTTEPVPAVSTPALAVTPPPPPVPTTQQPVQQTVQQPAPQPIPPPPPPPQPVVQPVETPEQAQQVASTFVPENVKQAEQTAPEQTFTIKPIALDESKLTDAQKKERAKQQAIMIEQARKKFNESLKKKQQESAKRLQQAIATQPTPKRLPQRYRPTQEEQKEIQELLGQISNTPESKLLNKEGQEFGKIQQKELGPYYKKIMEARRQFGPQSQEFKNALESMRFQNRLFAKQYAPTIQRLNKLREDVNNSDATKNFREAYDRIFKRNKIQENVPSQFNKGGMSMEQQMSLFEEGGMKDDGLNIDPVSGNDIPPGSLAKEVRDDIPAQLSDGEYVVPADVVQYYGVKFFEDLRAEAKAGLAEMEATGRIGGEPMAVDMTMIAFGQKDKDKKEKKATGGVVGFDNGGVSSDQEAINKSQPKFDIEDYAVPGFTPGSSIYQVRSGVQTGPKPTSTVVYRTYYGPNNEAKSVPGTLDANGNWNVNQGYEEFVKSPWTSTPKQQVSKDRDDKKTPPPGWGADPEKFDFTGWTAENWNKEVDSLLNPEGILGKTIGQNGFFRAASVANAYAAIELAKAKGINTSKMEEKVKDAYDDLGTFGKVIVTGTNKLLNFGGEGAYAETISRTNPSYANLDSGKTTTPTPTSNNNNNQNDNEERRQRKKDIERATKESLSKVTTDDVSKAAKKKGGGTAKTSTGEMIKADEQTGFESRFYKKGGLIQRPKRKNKK